MKRANDGLDAVALRFVRRHTPAGRFLDLVRAYARLGEHGAVWVLLGLARGDRRGATSVVRAYVLNQLVKVVVRRRRPELADAPPLIPTQSKMSFPSAHATTSFAALRAYGGGALMRVAATAMGASRVYLGVHWPSDVLAGAALGTAIGRRAR